MSQFLVLILLTLAQGLETTEEVHENKKGGRHNNEYPGVHYEDGEMMLYAVTFS